MVPITKNPSFIACSALSTCVVYIFLFPFVHCQMNSDINYSPPTFVVAVSREINSGLYIFLKKTTKNLVRKNF